MLNSDYKIFTSTITARILPALIDHISPQQTGFVPGRNITDNTHLLNLLQTTLEDMHDSDPEAGAGGAFILIDQEKAFDSCAWTTIREAFKSVGFGAYTCSLIDTICNPNVPLERRIRINGIRDPTPFQFPCQMLSPPRRCTQPHRLCTLHGTLRAHVGSAKAAGWLARPAWHSR